MGPPPQRFHTPAGHYSNPLDNVHATTMAPTVGQSARGFIIRWVQSSSTTTMSSSPAAVSSPRMQLIKLTGSSVKVFRVCAGRLPHPGRLQHLRQPAVCIRVRVRSKPKKVGFGRLHGIQEMANMELFIQCCPPSIKIRSGRTRID